MDLVIQKLYFKKGLLIIILTCITLFGQFLVISHQVSQLVRNKRVYSRKVYLKFLQIFHFPQRGQLRADISLSFPPLIQDA